MSLTLSNAEECDVGDIADIHLASFGENMMLQAQFPTPALRAGLRISLMEKAREEIRDPQWAVLVVRNQNEIISFAKWMRPVLDADSYVEVPWRWPEGTRMDILNEWARKVEDASSSVIGSTPCYCLSFIGTHPSYERRGAATMLIQWGLERSVKENVPIQLESTIVAWPLYKRLGFEDKKRILMQLEGLRKDGQSVLYEELSLVCKPEVASTILNRLTHKSKTD
ncbi:GNAT family acetyltransferase [Histoplasma capsulatum var. duboisii H88]|uniref:GNAT family acetyltransferase n=1 Tax=Ajellomyces capsulatus (strain H88) TaxID=544711 RepID=A0A8A1LKI3_AJEC8|nr:GNAT family acetyltransferase [Histoplasma capsulatum var. duboisii H88]